ncbi:ABC transporter ATP-binding protein [Periweissella ghanensis]|uniref:Hemin import ATP-binding protein HrtA n=1 Tax=Periweissella ghanensis TaxID=467997 RepID=A0ABM8ZCM0_9LACO|nr:ABC transporter ATP-binding protein [Periweissella ghanensis]MCM0601355.1 ABC transporter ATP-binding protein [Periweissella ghanensis]CAH0419288.1 Putative hemin import ATP-binding protein HrtA [Periweissella ghanensis]
MANLELKNVSKVYGSGVSQLTALNKVNFAAHEGETVLIVGPSGSGKTTFLTIAGGLQTPSTGEVLINGSGYSSTNKNEQSALRLNKIGFVLQAYNLVPFLTVAEQFELVDKVKQNNMAAERFEGVLDTLGIKDLLAKYPKELSGGQRQRVAIARALYADPEYILADEPTAALDTNRSLEVMSLFNQLAHKYQKAVIVVTHDQRLEEKADKVYQIIDGQMSLLKDKTE